MKEYTVKVTDVLHRTPTSVSIRMDRPDSFDYKAGQWGYFTLGGRDDGLSRPLSFSSSPTEPFLEFTKRMTGSDFSEAVGKLGEGDEVTFRGPMGNLVYEGGLEKVTFVAGGIGITPIRSILKYAMDTGTTGHKTLIYGNADLRETAFIEEVEGWGARREDFSLFLVLLEPPEGWDGFTGFIHTGVISEVVPDLAGQTFYVSGPPPMVKAVIGALEELDISDEKIIKEELEGYEGMV